MASKRIGARYNCLIKIKYKSTDGKINGYCFTKDLSKEGAGLPLDRYIAPSKSLILEIDLPENEKKFVAETKVAWCKKNRSHWEPLYSAGVKFKKINAGSMEKLLNFASDHEWQKNDFEKDLETDSLPIIR